MALLASLFVTLMSPASALPVHITSPVVGQTRVALQDIAPGTQVTDVVVDSEKQVVFVAVKNEKGQRALVEVSSVTLTANDSVCEPNFNVAALERPAPIDGPIIPIVKVSTKSSDNNVNAKPLPPIVEFDNPAPEDFTKPIPPFVKFNTPAPGDCSAEKPLPPIIKFDNPAPGNDETPIIILVKGNTESSDGDLNGRPIILPPPKGSHPVIIIFVKNDTTSSADDLNAKPIMPLIKFDNPTLGSAQTCEPVFQTLRLDLTIFYSQKCDALKTGQIVEL